MIYIPHSENLSIFHNIKIFKKKKQLLKLVGKTFSWSWLQHYKINNKSRYKSESWVEHFHSHSAEVDITSNGK